MLANFQHALLGLLEFLRLARTQLPGMLDGLLEPRDLCAYPVVVSLHYVERLALLAMPLARRLQFRLDTPQLCHGGLQGVLAFAQRRLLLSRLRLQPRQAQHEELGLEPALLRLHFAIALCGARLALQVADLLFDLITQVVEPIEVLARVPDARLGLAAPFLVPGNARRFLEVHPQLLGLGLDKARDHSLLDDRVTARTEPGAEKKAGDVLAATARPVEEIVRGPVARQHPSGGDLAETGVLPAHRTIRVVEHQLDGRRADRLAGTRAVEYDVGHRIAAQVLGRAFTHDPSHCVDDVGFTATVRTDDADQVAGESDRGRIDK